MVFLSFFRKLSWSCFPLTPLTFFLYCYTQTMLNCPPAPESSDSHGNELIRTLSEKQTSLGIALKREIKVHVLGPDPDDATKTRIEIREDMVHGGDDGKPAYSEHRETISIVRKFF